MKHLLKNKMAILLIALILIIVVYFLYFKNNPYSSGNLPVKEQLDIFYEAFMAEDYTAIAEISVNNNPQDVINVRPWYGEVNKYKIKSIKNIDGQHKEAKIIVRSMRNEKHEKNIDTIDLKKEGDKWLIYIYNTNFRHVMP